MHVATVRRIKDGGVARSSEISIYLNFSQPHLRSLACINIMNIFLNANVNIYFTQCLELTYLALAIDLHQENIYISYDFK